MGLSLPGCGCCIAAILLPVFGLTISSLAHTLTIWPMLGRRVGYAVEKNWVNFD